MELLLRSNKVRAATHNIMAYRIQQQQPSPQQQAADNKATFLQVRR